MSAKEVTALRKSGQLQEAYEMAKKNLEAAPDNKFNKSAMAWVLYEYLKKAAQEKQFDKFIGYLESLVNLNLPEDEKMIFDNCAFQIFSISAAVSKQGETDTTMVNRMFDAVKKFHFTRPSEAWTAVFKAFHKFNKSWTRYLEFVDWWRLDNFLPKDYLKEEFEGSSFMSIAEQAYTACARKVLEQIHNPQSSFPIDSEYVQSFMKRLEQLTDDHPEYQYPPYYLAKFFLASGTSGNVLDTFLPFARRKQKDFWVWDLLADIYRDNEETQFTCYCKALMVEAPGRFLVNMRQKFVPLMLKKGLYDEARWEVEQIVKDRTKEQWKIPPKIVAWQQESWYKSASSVKDPRALYRQHSRKAEQLLYEDLPEETIVVINVNREKHILNYRIDRTRTGFFNYEQFLDEPRLYDLLKVRFRKREESGFSSVHTARKVDDGDCPLIKKFNGTLKVINDQFGFVEDVFISPDFINQFSLNQGDILSGRALEVFNKKKNEWGWRAVRIDSEGTQ